MSSRPDDHTPSWMDQDNDRQHLEKVSLLEAEEGKIDYGGVAHKKDDSSIDASDKKKQPRDDHDDDDEGNTKVTLDSTVAPAVDPDKVTDPVSKLATRPHVPRQNPCLWCFHLLEGITIIGALCLLVTQVLPLFLVPYSEIANRIGFLSLALKVYIALFCFLVMATESNLPFMQRSPLLHTYWSRGFLYSFIGLICVEEAYSERVKDIVARGKVFGQEDFHIGWQAIFMQISSWLMLAVGACYMLLGVCCMRRYRDRMEEREKEEWRQYREAEKAWKRKYGDRKSGDDV